jgi:hypothetical protein
MYFLFIAVFEFFFILPIFLCDFRHLDVSQFQIASANLKAMVSLERDMAEIKRSFTSRPFAFLNESYCSLSQSAVEEALERIKQQKGVEG